MTDSATQDLSVLSAYSAGEIGWREACKKLVLMDIEELHDALREHDIVLPSDEQDTRENKAETRRFADLLKKKGE